MMICKLIITPQQKMAVTIVLGRNMQINVTKIAGAGTGPLAAHVHRHRVAGAGGEACYG